MADAEKKWPGYGFMTHKGYGTSGHWKVLEVQGPTEFHRKSFLKRLVAREIGQQGEALAENFLKAQRFQILHRNWKSRFRAELDLVAEKNGELHFVEVRTRSKDWFTGVEDLFPKRKREQFQKAVAAYLAENRVTNQKVHLDLVALEGERIEPHWDVLSF